MPIQAIHAIEKDGVRKWLLEIPAQVTGNPYLNYDTDFIE